MPNYIRQYVPSSTVFITIITYNHQKIAPKDWKFSSFKKYVKHGFYDENWCNYDDKNRIINLDLG